jgi:hypothetical protein
MSELVGTPRWLARIEKCPGSDEENLCVGRFAVYAYLQMSGNASLPRQVGLNVTCVKAPVDAKILPLKLYIPFSVDFADTPFSDIDVEKCGAAKGPFKAGENEVEYPECVGTTGYVRTVTRVRTNAVIEEDNDCIFGQVELVWRSGLVVILNSVTIDNLTVNGIPFADPIVIDGGVDTNTVLVDVQEYSATFEYRICYPDGCVATTDPQPNGPDAETVFLQA